MIKYIFILLFFPVIAFAQDAAAVPEWLGAIVNFLATIPYVGPVVTEILKWTGLVASLMTALSIFLQALFAIPEIVARWAGATDVAAQIKKWSDIILPYVKYLSVFNVQKKK